MTTMLAVAAALLVTVGIAIHVRRKRRRLPARGTMLQPSSRTGADLVYPYYVDGTQLKTIAAGVNVEIPLSRAEEHTDGAAAAPTGATVKTEVKLTVQLATELNLAAFARRLRALEERFVAASLALAPEDWQEQSKDSMIAAKAEEFAAVGTGKTILLRGQFEPVQDGTADEVTLPMHLRLTHFSREILHDDEYPGTGNFAVMRLPPELELVVILHVPDCLISAGQERLSRGEPFFGEVIAASPSFDRSTGRLTCAAAAVWGCAQPEPITEDGQ